MCEDDFNEFAELLDAAYDLIGSGANKIISISAKGMFFRAVANHSIEAFRAALVAHIVGKDGQWVPKPSHIIAQIEGAAANDGRPGSEEAWAIALTSRDEADTVVWTAETAEAFALCQPVLSMGDEVGARMAFKEAYARIVLKARQAHQPARWAASLGWDMTKRVAVLHKASTAGLLAGPSVAALLPAPIAEPMPDAQAREQIAKIRQMLADTMKDKADAADRVVESDWREGEQQKAEISAKVAIYRAAAA